MSADRTVDGLLCCRAGKEAGLRLESNKRCITVQGLLGNCKDFSSAVGATGLVWAVE